MLDNRSSSAASAFSRASALDTRKVSSPPTVGLYVLSTSPVRSVQTVCSIFIVFSPQRQPRDGFDPQQVVGAVEQPGRLESLGRQFHVGHLIETRP